MFRAPKIYFFEPLFFLFFGVMHTSRVWAFWDRQSYADAWLNLLYGKGLWYYMLMICMAGLCALGIIAFMAERGHNPWWRWIYIFGGGYILFDLFAIATGLPFWNHLLLWMFDTASPFWYPLWGFFVAMGLFCLVLGAVFIRRLWRQKRSWQPIKRMYK